MSVPAARVRKRSVVIAGHATSVSLEEAFWSALKDIARRQGRSVNALVTEIDRARAGNLSSAIRVFVLEALAGGADSAAPAAGLIPTCTDKHPL